MNPVEPRTFIPVDVVFHPNWWHRNYGISFEEPFFFDPDVRVREEVKMRRALHERFGDLGLGEPDPRPEPVVGPVHLAAGYLTAAALGCRVEFFKDAPPEVLPRNLSEEEFRSYEPPPLDETPLMRSFMKLMDSLETRFGYLTGDVNWAGIHNDAVNLRGQEWFLDYYRSPGLVHRMLDLLAEFVVEFVSLVCRRTGTSSLSVNRVIAGVDPGINLHSNCTVTMISPEFYREFVFPRENRLAGKLVPYGIHHCGNNMDVYAGEYAGVSGSVFFDVGWGSDVARCRRLLPDRVLSLRLSPARLMRQTPDEVSADVSRLLEAARPLNLTAVCAVNLDYGTPDDNVRAIFDTVERYRHYGA